MLVPLSMLSSSSMMPKDTPETLMSTKGSLSQFPLDGGHSNSTNAVAAWEIENRRWVRLQAVLRVMGSSSQLSLGSPHSI
jgi:hypothetical protein